MTSYFDIIMIPLPGHDCIFYHLLFCPVFIPESCLEKKRKKITTPKTTFAVIAAAHNEERVIGELVENLRMLRYPDSMYEIFVVADNCTDHTADVARKAGASVHERFNDTEKGEGLCP